MKRPRWLWLPSRATQNVVLAALIATLALLLSSPDVYYHPALVPFYSLEKVGYDTLFTVRGPRLERLDPRIEVVGFDRQTEQSLGVRWPPPRRFHAKVIENLAKDGAELIVYDVLFSDRSTPADDKALDKALKKAGNVVLPHRIDRDYAYKRKSLEEPYYDDELGVDFLAAARDGFAEVPQDTDDVVRRIAPVQWFRDRWLPSMSAAAYLRLRNRPAEDLAVGKKSIRIGDVDVPRTGPSIQDPSGDSSIIPSAYIDFPAGAQAFTLDTNFYQVAQGQFQKGKYKGKIVFVGLVGSELVRENLDHDSFDKENFDQYVTAYTNHSAEGVGSMGYTHSIPGVFVQAMNFNALLMKGFVTRLPAWALWILVFGLAIASASALRSNFNWRGPAVLVLCTLGYISYSIFAFRVFLIHVPWLIPSILMFSSVSLVTYVERGALRRKWSGYVSPQVLERILKSEEDGAAQRYIASVVFGDIRGFTGFTTQHSPETVVKLLNLHFERMTAIIYAEHGTIDKFMGDGVMALFGAPVARADSALCAVRAAWLMCQAARQPIVLDGEPYLLESGFGVTTGPLVAGHVGSKMRHDFTVIGDVVNMSARLQGVTGGSDVVIDVSTYALVAPYVDVENLGGITIKGISEPIECFKVTALREVPAARTRRARKKPGISIPTA